MPKDDALQFVYPDGEAALKAVKKVVRKNPELHFRRAALDDGTVCFEIVDGQKVLERHLVSQGPRTVF